MRQFAYWCFAKAAKKIRAQNPFPKIFLANALEHWAKFTGKTVDSPVLGEVFVKESRHVGIATGVPFPNGAFPSIEGNTYNTPLTQRRDGVYALKKELVSRCTFIRFG